MPAHARPWLAGFIACGIVLTPAYGDPAPSSEPRAWFVAVEFSPLEDANPDEYPGRVEVTVAGRFVGCAWAAFYKPELTEVRLVPMSLGYAVFGRREDIKVQAYGELARIGKQQVQIKEADAQVIGKP